MRTKPQTAPRSWSADEAGAALAQALGNDCLNALLRASTHELNTPLAVIQGELETLSVHIGDGSSAACLHTIRGEVTRLIALSEDLHLRLELARDTLHFQLQAVDLLPVLRDVAMALEDQSPQHFVSIHMQVPVPKVMADRRLLERVLWLLLHNGLRYSSCEELTVQVGCGADGRGVEVVICDEAPALAGRAAEEIFGPMSEPARALERPPYCLGLGLHPCREIARRMGGSLRVEPLTEVKGGRRLEKGNRFTLQLSVAEESEHARRVAGRRRS